uniref:RNA-directed RNA polymerase n=1 Tax=Erysiphales associated toti-like virus 1 TaxID=2719861 RepID=A0A6G9ELK6_9VIRU|nr:RNA-dependent RNA polymerase [Erysiphales associated toti-like virus 1]
MRTLGEENISSKAGMRTPGAENISSSFSILSQIPKFAHARMGTPGEGNSFPNFTKYAGMRTPGEGNSFLNFSNAETPKHSEGKFGMRSTAWKYGATAGRLVGNNTISCISQRVARTNLEKKRVAGCDLGGRKQESILVACRRQPQVNYAQEDSQKEHAARHNTRGFSSMMGTRKNYKGIRIARGVASQLTTSVAGPMDVRESYGYKSDYFEVHKRIGAYVNSSGILQLRIKDGQPGVTATATYTVVGDVAPTSKVKEEIWLGWNSKPWHLFNQPGPSWQVICPSQIVEEMKRLSMRDYKSGPMQSVLDKVDKEHLASIAMGFNNALEIGDNHIALLFALAGYLTECTWAEQINAKKEVNGNRVYPRCIERWDDTAAMDVFVSRTATAVSTNAGPSAAALMWAAAGSQLPKWAVFKEGKKYLLPWSTMTLEPTAQIVVGLNDRPDFEIIPSEPLQVATIISEYVTRNGLNEQWEVAMDLAAVIPWCREEAWVKQLPKPKHVTDFYSSYSALQTQGVGTTGGVRIVTHINTGCASSVLTGLAIRSSIQSMINSELGAQNQCSVGAVAKKSLLTAPMNYAQLAEEGRGRSTILSNAMDSIMFLAGDMSGLYTQRARLVHSAKRVPLLANSLLGCQRDWAAKALLEGWTFEPVMIGMTLIELSAKERLLYKLSGLDNIEQVMPKDMCKAGMPNGTSPINLMAPKQTRRLTELVGRNLRLSLDRIDFEVTRWQVPRELFLGYHQYADITMDGSAPDADVREWGDVYPNQPNVQGAKEEEQSEGQQDPEILEDQEEYVPKSPTFEPESPTKLSARPDVEKYGNPFEYPAGNRPTNKNYIPPPPRVIKPFKKASSLSRVPVEKTKFIDNNELQLGESRELTKDGRDTKLYTRLTSNKELSPIKTPTKTLSPKVSINFHAEATPSPIKYRSVTKAQDNSSYILTGIESDDFKEQLASGNLKTSYLPIEGDEMLDVRDTELVDSDDDGWCGVHAILNSYRGMTGKDDWSVHKLKGIAQQAFGFDGTIGGLTEEHMAYLASHMGHGLAFYDEQGEYLHRIGRPSKLLPIRWKGNNHVLGYKLAHKNNRPAGAKQVSKQIGTISMKALCSKLHDILDTDADTDWSLALAQVLGSNWQVDYKHWLRLKNNVIIRKDSVSSHELVLLLASGPKPQGWSSAKLWVSWRKGKLGNHGWPSQLVSCPGLMPTVPDTQQWERNRTITPQMIGIHERCHSQWWPQWMANLWVTPGLAANESYKKQLDERFPVARAAGEGGARIRAHEAITEYGQAVKEVWPNSFKAILSTQARDNQSVTAAIMGLWAAAKDARPDIDRTIAACWRQPNRVECLKRVAAWAEKAGVITLTYINMWTARTTEEADWDAEERNRTSEPPILKNPAGEDISHKVEAAITKIIMNIDYRNKTSLKSETWKDFWMRRAEWAVSGAFQSSTGLKQGVIKPFISESGWEGRPNKRLAVDLLPDSLWEMFKNHPPKITAYPHTKRNELGNKARAIYGTDFESYAISAYAADGFEVRMLDQFEEMRPSAQTWFQTIMDLTQIRREGEMMAGFDYADFNIQHSNDSMSWFYKARAQWWKGAPISPEAKQDKMWACEWMAQAVQNQVVIHKLTGREYRTTRGMFSGIRDTTNMNTLLSRAYDDVVQDEWREYIGGRVQGGRFYGDDLHQGPCTIDKAYRLMQAKRKANLIAQLTKCEVGQNIQYLRVRYGPNKAEGSVQRSIASAVNGNWEVRGHQGREQGLQGVVQTLVARGYPTKGLLRLLVRAVARNRLQKLPGPDDQTCVILPKEQQYEVEEPILVYRLNKQYRKRFRATPMVVNQLTKECEQYVVRVTERQKKSIIRAAYAQLGIEESNGMAGGIALDVRRKNGPNLRIPVHSTEISYAQSRKAYIHELLGINQPIDQRIISARDPLQPYALSGSNTEEIKYPKIRVMI